MAKICKCGRVMTLTQKKHAQGYVYPCWVCRTCVKERSAAWYAALTPEQRKEVSRRNWKRRRGRSFERYLFTTIKNRKNSRGGGPKTLVLLSFDEFLAEIGGTVPKVCPVLGIPLRMATGLHDDNSPSVDRIDNDRPYEKGNIAIISLRANFLKRNGTAEEHRRIADWMDQRSGK